MLDPWLEVDCDKLEELEEVYAGAREVIEQDYRINLNSPPQVKSFLREELGESVSSAKTEEIEELLNKYPENSPEHDLLLGITYYQKMHFSSKNYIRYFLNSNSDGRIYLTKNVHGEIELPNHRPLPGSPEILDCITDAGNGLKLKTKDGEKHLIYKKGIKI